VVTGIDYGNSKTLFLIMTLSEYFTENRYKSTFFIGDRVEGYYNNEVMFVGTVLNDSVVSENQEPVVSVYLDLPLMYNNTIHKMIFVSPSELKLRS
jgi:hypothetical protein